MRRDDATKLCRTVLDDNGLRLWHVQISDLTKEGYIAVCMHGPMTIVMNYHAIDIHPDAEIINTIKHEVAHALVGPGHGHDDVWRKKATELGCDNISAICSINIPQHIVEAIRSNQVVESVITEEIIPQQTIRKVDYRVTKLQDKCPECGKVAKETRTLEFEEQKFTFLECGHLVIKQLPKGSPFHLITFDGDKNCEHVWPDKIHEGKKLRGTICGKCDAKRPYQYQIDGMKFLEKNFGRAGLFDEQGLGKTCQALGYLLFHPEKCPFLYVCKSGLKYQAMKEILRIMGERYVPIIIENSNSFILSGFNCYIVSFDLLRRMKQNNLEKLTKLIKTVVIDECQHIKNPDSTRTAEVRKLCKDIKNIIPLSGTPWKNRGSEFFVVSNLINPVKFNSFENFKTRWVDYPIDPVTGKVKEGGINPKRLEEFKAYTSDVFIRRERSEVMKELPLINRTKLYAELPKELMKQYEDAADEFVAIWNNLILEDREGSFGGNSGIQGALMRMRQIIGIAKIPATIDYVEEFLENTDRKIVVFAHHIAVQQEIFKQLKDFAASRENGDSIEVLQLVSTMNAEARFDVQNKFNNNKECRVLIASTLASGEGLNLQTCADCVMHERQWNPANEEQAEGRFIRIGQKASQVNAVYTQAVETVDEDLDNIVSTKRIIFHAGMNKGIMPSWNENSITKQLGEAIAARWRKKNRK